MFQELNRVIREEVILHLFHAQIEATGEGGGGPDGGPLPQPGPNGGPNGRLDYSHQSLAGADAIAAAGNTTSTAAVAGGGAVATKPVVKSAHENIGRNEPCWCGSGKKYKRCHGA
jgi:preprotein translocase subunit SecA